MKISELPQLEKYLKTLGVPYEKESVEDKVCYTFENRQKLVVRTIFHTTIYSPPTYCFNTLQNIFKKYKTIVNGKWSIAVVRSLNKNGWEYKLQIKLHKKQTGTSITVVHFVQDPEAIEIAKQYLNGETEEGILLDIIQDKIPVIQDLIRI